MQENALYNKRSYGQQPSNNNTTKMTTRSGLSLAQAPPLSVPLRFFLTAPLFGILTAVVFIGYGPDTLLSRWTPATLAATHLIALGYITLIMVGAISQMLPVLTGSPMPRPLLVSTIIHILLTLGALVLAGGLLLENNPAIQLSVFFLGAGFLLFTVVNIFSLTQAKTHNSTVSGMWLAVGSLVVAVVLGLRLAAEHIWNFDTGLSKSWTDVHLAWGLIGWMGVLVIGVAYEVVPMFQMTPRYPQWMQRWLTKLILTGLVLWASLSLLPIVEPATQTLLMGALSSALAAGLALFAGTTLYLQRRRRRRLKDVTLRFWNLAMYSLLACSLLWMAGQLWPALANWHGFGYLLGILFIAGFVVSVVNGMLYKIVPFLIWLHLQSQNRARIKLPNMKEIIQDRWTLRQFYLHGLSLLLLLGGVFEPLWFLYPLAIFFAFSSLLLFLNIYSALSVYKKVRGQQENRG
ncbi:MAG: hypothetical protein L3K24_08715 [Gammaproteobacteria bacterium]|nr:hypothetical protein [Gammaproteobacteria bacterium]